MSPAPEGLLRLRAPAKINLGLRITGIREDGYHLLESVFAPIDLSDELELEIAPGASRIELEVEIAEDASLPKALSDVAAGPENLVHRAARAFCDATGFAGALRMHLRKRIPAGAGLGGGSSDAAAVLTGLRALTKSSQPACALSDESLARLALGLGADVPFFLDPRPALVTGIGEAIEPLTGFPALDLVVANPGISLATAEVYRASDVLRSALTDSGAGSTMRAVSRLRGETGGLAPALGDLLVNDLEPAARRLCPPIARLSDRLLEAGALSVSMSGSGATVFGVFGSASDAQRALGAGVLGAEEGDVGWARVTRLIPRS